MKQQIHNVGFLYSYYYDLVMLLISITLVCRDNNQSCYLTKLLHTNKKEGRNLFTKILQSKLGQHLRNI